MSGVRNTSNNTRTIHFNPRPTFAKFLISQKQRYNVPDQKTYKNRSFIRF